MHTIGLDLAVQAAHKAVVADEQGRFITSILTLRTRTRELDQLLLRARNGKPDRALWVVMEPTGMAWFPIAVYLIRHEVTVYLVNSQEVADLRRYDKRHAKSDRIDARVLARLPLVNPEHLPRFHLPSAKALACQRSCKQLDRLGTLINAIQHRVQAIDRFAWPGLEEQVKALPFAPAARWMRSHCYDPQRVLEAGAAKIREQWQGSSEAADCAGDWVEALVDLAAEVVTLYGAEHQYLDFVQLQAEVCQEQEWLATLEQQHQTLRKKTIRPLYRQIHPSRNLETLKGVGQDSAAVYASFIGDAQRFSSTRVFRGWSGMVPESTQSADSEAKGLHLTQAGPDLVKKFASLDAEIARRWDPQRAAIYYDQRSTRANITSRPSVRAPRICSTGCWSCCARTRPMSCVMWMGRKFRSNKPRRVTGRPNAIGRSERNGRPNRTAQEKLSKSGKGPVASSFTTGSPFPSLFGAYGAYNITQVASNSRRPGAGRLWPAKGWEETPP